MLGSFSISSRLRGKTPRRFVISVARFSSEEARRRQRPIGFNCFRKSLDFPEAIAVQEGYRLMNLGRNSATTSALVRCKSTSDTIFTYLLADGRRHKKSRPLSENQSRSLSLNQSIFLLECNCEEGLSSYPALRIPFENLTNRSRANYETRESNY
jgi:hypothetical protein